MLGNIWQYAGKYLAVCWGTFDNMLGNIWQFVGEYLAICWGMFGNMWGIFGNRLENI